jgi:hypothetical protein
MKSKCLEIATDHPFRMMNSFARRGAMSKEAFTKLVVDNNEEARDETAAVPVSRLLLPKANARGELLR